MSSDGRHQGEEIAIGRSTLVFTSPKSGKAFQSYLSTPTVARFSLASSARLVREREKIYD
jgi:hypothetical protein